MDEDDLLQEEEDRALEEQMAIDQGAEMEDVNQGGGEATGGAGPSVAFARASPPPPDDNDNDEDAPNSDWLASSDDEEHEYFAHGQTAQDRQAQSSDGDGDDAGGGGGNDDGASSTYTHRLHQGLQDIPGWTQMMMGQGIDPKPPLFSTGMSGYWAAFSNTGPFRDGVKCRPARVIDMGFVGAWQQASDAERVCDMTAQTDQVARGRTVATCALMGLLSVGMAKGLVASPNHSELSDARRGDPEEVSKAERKLNGKVKTYTYCPNATSTDPVEREETAMMFSFVHIAMHNSKGKYVGFKILMLIFDKGFSLDELVNKVMKENALIKRSGNINEMPEEQRTSKMVQQNKLQRSQLDDNNLEVTAATQYKRICGNQDYLKFLINVGGQSYGQHGRPYYENIGKDTPPGCTIHEFAKCPENEYGGRHPIGPTISHNHKRFVAPSDESPGVNVFTAGTLDARGKPIDLHESLLDPRQWYDEHGYFDPPQHVKDNGWCHICHDPSVTNIMSAQLPHKMHGNVEPEECLLRIFWKRNKDSNPILKKAVDRGLTTFEKNRDSVLALFHRMEDTLDPEQQALSRAVLETEMLSPDSLDKSAAEEATLERRAYGKTSTDKGEKWVLSVRQPLRDISIEQEKVHAMVNDDDKQTRLEIATHDYDIGQGASMEYDVPAAMRKRRANHAEATKATIKLGLQRFAHTYGRAKCIPSIPPGYYDVAKVGTDASIKEAGEIGKRRAVRSSNLGRVVDPDDPNALLGTANIGQAHGQSLVATDLTPFGHHRAFLMRLFSSGVQIAGRDVKLMLECHVHAFEPFQEVSFFLMLCGGPGSGKSMRAKRMMALLPSGWVKGSGGGSAKAGMNGGFDHLCGRLVYYDEITSDFASQDSERIEYLKSITMEQRVLNTRTVKTIGSNGIESFTTVVIDSLHYESHLMCTNCGPLGLKGDNEPSTNRAALSDRSWAHIVHSNEDHDTNDTEFDVQTCSDDVKQQVNRYRVCACLVAYVLIFIKHIPSCRPDLSYANLLCNKWYEILWTEYNLPRPSKRKKIKLRMMLELFATESAVFEKFCMPESGVDFPDMRPDENGHLSPFCIEQLVDVVCSMQRCLDHEVIHNAWSHSLDHSPATAAHTFQMKTVLAQLHGSELDRRVLVGDPVPQEAPAAPQAPSQGRVDPVAQDEASRDHLDQQFAMPSSSAGAAPSAPAPSVPTPSAPAPSAPAASPGNAPPVTPRTGTPANWNNPGPTQPPNGIDGNPTHSHYPLAVQTMDENMTRQRAADTADEFATTRELRCELSHRALTKKIGREGSSEHSQLTKLLTDCVGERDREPKHRMASTGEMISARQAAGACMPNASDLLNRGMDMGFLVEIANGKAAKAQHFGVDEAKIGIKKKGWEFETLPGEVVLKGPADFDFNWARLTAFAKNSQAAEGAAPAAGAKQKSSLWGNAARVIRAASASGVFSLMALHSMSLESMRDVLFMIGWSTIENKIRLPKKVQANRWGYSSGNNGGFNMDDRCMESLGYAITDAKAISSEGIHPKHMFSKLNPYILDPAFEAPVGMERPHNSTVGLSLGQKRLDHLTNHRALPVCIMPEGFERGVPIKTDEAANGIYFNKHTASEQSALVMETGLFLATVPGIAGGRFTTVPDSFKGTHPNPTEARDKQDAQLEAVRKQQQQQQQPQQPPQSGPGWRPPSPSGENAHLADGLVISDDEELGPNQVRRADSEPDDDDTYLEIERTPELPESEAQSSDHESVRNSVLRPDSDDLNMRPRPGASDRAARASVDPSATVPALPYEWDQLAIFFSIKMIETLHNDVHTYVDKYRSKFGDVYDEEREETLSGLPQISIRFPGMVDSKTTQSGEEKTRELMPLSCSVPLEQSRFCDMATHIKATRASKGLTEAVHSFAHGRAIAFNDPEVLEHEAEVRGLNSGVIMEGNLFARSTWQRFTLSVLDARGMRTPEEEARVADQGLCMRLRVRNHRSAAGHDDRDPALGAQAEARPHTFTAQERNKRKLGNADEDDDVPMESVPAKRRSLEREREKQLLDESMDIEPSV